MLHGRMEECAAVDRLLTEAQHLRSGALVLRGEAGMGKSTLLAYARAQARSAGDGPMGVLRATGVEAEAELPFAALHQLLRPVLDHIPRLPDPQATALGGAFGLAEGHVDRFLVSVAVLSLLAEVAEQQPLLCLVDDAHWLDRASVDALVFAARRLEAEGIALLFAARDGEGRFQSPGLPELRLTGLSGAAAAAVLAERAPTGISPVVADRLIRLTGGNPLALLELPSALTAAQLSGHEPLPDPLPVGGGVEHAFRARFRHLPGAAQRLLLVAAAEERGDAGTVLRAAAALGCGQDALEAAEAAGLLRMDESGVTFRHPLVRSSVYRGATFSQRRAAHEAIADALVGDAEIDRRAWHRAAAVVGPDEGVAAELERSAERARSRGGYAAAAAALERAAELSADQAPKVRRLVAAADAAWTAGLTERARALLDAAAPLLSDTLDRADAQRLRGVMELNSGMVTRAYDVLVQGAEDVAAADPFRAATMLSEAGRAAWDSNDAARLDEAARRLERLRLPQDGPAAFAGHLLEGMAGMAGDTPARGLPLLREAAAVAQRDGQPSQLGLAAAGAVFRGDDVAALALYALAVSRSRELGAVAALTAQLGPYAALEAYTGRYRSAAANATEGLRLAEETGQENFAAINQSVLAWVSAVQGHEDDCRALAGAALERALVRGFRPAAAFATWALGLSALTAGRPAEALPLLQEVWDGSDRSHRTMAMWAAGDLIAAAFRAGTLEPARPVLPVLARWAEQTGAAWALAVVARSRGLLATGAETHRHLEEALRLHAGGTRPFDHARTELLYGELLRRDRHRTEARSHLRAAAETFGRLGAAPWEARAMAELRASGETMRSRDPSALDRLTPQELQIVRVVREGATNRQVAAQLFLSPRTIDYHLRKVFVKLGLSSRAELMHLELDGMAPSAHA